MCVCVWHGDPLKEIKIQRSSLSRYLWAELDRVASCEKVTRQKLLGLLNELGKEVTRKLWLNLERFLCIDFSWSPVWWECFFSSMLKRVSLLFEFYLLLLGKSGYAFCIWWFSSAFNLICMPEWHVLEWQILNSHDYKENRRPWEHGDGLWKLTWEAGY